MVHVDKSGFRVMVKIGERVVDAQLLAMSQTERDLEPVALVAFEGNLVSVPLSKIITGSEAGEED